jgi:adapter protein MecA 1/2
MRVERLGGDKIRFFLTLDDLMDRGIEKEDMWRDIPKVHELFNDMMEHAYHELGFEVVGPVAVEVFALPAQGMVVIVSCSRLPKIEGKALESEEDVYELEVTMEETDDIVFRFTDFEHLIQAAIRVQFLIIQGGQVYFYEGSYYLVFGDDLITVCLDTLVAILSEFGEVTTVTNPILQEYGKAIWSEDAVGQLIQYFS